MMSHRFVRQGFCPSGEVLILASFMTRVHALDRLSQTLLLGIVKDAQGGVDSSELCNPITGSRDSSTCIRAQILLPAAQCDACQSSESICLRGFLSPVSGMSP